MNPELRKQLDRCREDYSSVVGSPFRFFYCPILGIDEDVPLQKGHIINEAFQDSARAWVVQRRDVDSFYGTHFEGDFVKIQGAHALSYSEILADKSRVRDFNVKFLRNGTSVKYIAGGSKPLPSVFTPLVMEGQDDPCTIGLKMTQDDLLAAIGDNWEIDMKLDLRISALVSLIKAAHLSLFRSLGYTYSMSANGFFVGMNILGRFFRANLGKERDVVRANANSFFREYRHMVRPLLHADFDVIGSVKDHIFFACMGSSDRIWGMIVFVKTGSLTHGVLIPVFDDVVSVETYFDFLKNDRESINVTTIRFEPQERRWHLSPDRRNLTWPKTNTMYPEL